MRRAGSDRQKPPARLVLQKMGRRSLQIHFVRAGLMVPVNNRQFSCLVWFYGFKKQMQGTDNIGKIACMSELTSLKKDLQSSIKKMTRLNQNGEEITCIPTWRSWERSCIYDKSTLRGKEMTCMFEWWRPLPVHWSAARWAMSAHSWLHTNLVIMMINIIITLIIIIIMKPR